MIMIYGYGAMAMAKGYDYEMSHPLCITLVSNDMLHYHYHAEAGFAYRINPERRVGVGEDKLVGVKRGLTR